MRLFFFSVVAFLALLSYGQQRTLKGFVESKEENIPLHGAHIVNRSKGTLVTSAPNGTFKIPAAPGDTVEITYIGYQPFLTLVTAEMLESNILIAMTAEEVLLEDVVVTPFPDYWDFKQSIIELEIPDSTLKIPVPNAGAYAFYDPRSAPLPDDIPPPAIGIPFDLSSFTKQA